jgi:sigma-B regulation protein RsbU (phosphoserine phosphatase)
MAPLAVPVTREDLLDRRSRLEQSLASLPGDPQFSRLLQEVDGALGRMDAGTFGRCEVCREPIEEDRLAADPLLRFCIDHLSPVQRDALSSDLALAAQIQRGLLPPPGFRAAGWEADYLYRPANVVGGDYCDLLAHGNGLFFAVGDVSGKGVAAGFQMAHLHAAFRALVAQDLPLPWIMAQANRIFCESSPGNRFATLACGRADEGGGIEIGIAGHTPALVVRGGEVETVASTGLPIGMFCAEEFPTRRLQLAAGDTLLLYSDGLTEALDPGGEEYGLERLIASLRAAPGRSSGETVSGCLAGLDAFRQSQGQGDDLTILALRRENS